MPVWFGVLLSSLASCMNALGLNLQRMASSLPNKNPNNSIQSTIRHYTNAKSLNSIGICFSTMCGVVEGISLGYAPQSTLAPLGALTLVVNLLLAPVLHNEKITKSDSFLTLVIIIGVVTCIMGGNADEQEYTVKDLHTLSQNSMFHKMIGILTSLFVILGLHVIMNGNKNKKASKKAKDKTKEYNSLSIGFVYPVVAGIFGGLTVLSVKILTIVGTSSEGIVYHWKLIVVLVAINLTFAIAQIIINGIGLSKHSALVMVPIYSSAFVLSNAMGGGIFFKEFDKLNERGVNMYMCGVSFVIFGVLSMAYIKHKEIEEQAANTKKEKDVIDPKDEVDDEELPKGIKKTKRSKSKGRTTPKSSSKKKTKKSLNTRGSSPELKISK